MGSEAGYDLSKQLHSVLTFKPKIKLFEIFLKAFTCGLGGRDWSESLEAALRQLNPQAQSWLLTKTLGLPVGLVDDFSAVGRGRGG